MPALTACSVVPLYNMSPYHLWDGLKTILMDDASVNLGFPEQIRKNQFDIVQHLGLLYHVRDPLLTLSQARSVIKTGGYLLFEPLSHTIRTIHDRRAGKYEIGRAAIVKAIPGKEMELASYRELLRTFRNPGLVPDYL